jgi:hypothetical protein
LIAEPTHFAAQPLLARMAVYQEQGSQFPRAAAARRPAASGLPSRRPRPSAHAAESGARSPAAPKPAGSGRRPAFAACPPAPPRLQRLRSDKQKGLGIRVLRGDKRKAFSAPRSCWANNVLHTRCNPGVQLTRMPVCSSCACLFRCRSRISCSATRTLRSTFPFPRLRT